MFFSRCFIRFLLLGLRIDGVRAADASDERVRVLAQIIEQLALGLELLREEIVVHLTIGTLARCCCCLQREHACSFVGVEGLSQNV